MAKLINASTNMFEELPEDQVQKALAAGTHGFAQDQTINFINPEDGQSYSAPAQYTQAILQAGARLENTADIQERKDVAEFGERPLAAATAGAARGFSFGLSDVLGAKLGYSDSLRKLKKQNETASLVGEVGGVGAGFLVPGANLVKGASLLGQGVSHAVAPVATRLIGEGAGLGLKAAAQRIAGKAIAAGAGSAAEGALYGLGQTVSESALGNVEVNGELLASNIGISALVGGAISAAIPVAGGLLRGANKLRPGTTALGEDGFVVTDAVNRAYAKAASVFGANEQEYLRVLRDPALRDRAFAMTEDGVSQQIRDVGNNLAKAAKEVSGEGYSLVDDAIAKKAAELSDKGAVNTFGAELRGQADDILTRAKSTLADTPDSFDSATQKAVKLADNALEGMVPGLKEDWNLLRDKVLSQFPDAELVSRTGNAKQGSFLSLPEGVAPEIQKDFAKLQVKSVVRAKQEIQEAMTPGFKIEGTATNQKFLLSLKDELNDVALNIPTIGDSLKGANSAYASFKQDMGALLKNMVDRDGNLDAQKAINFVKAGGNKGEKVDDIILRAENYLTKIDELHTGSSDQAVVGKVQALRDSFEQLKTLRDAGSDLRSIEAMRGMAGPSASGIGAIGNAVGVLTGNVNPVLGAALAPATSPYFYLKGLNSFKGVLDKQVNLSRLGRLERILGEETKTVGDVAANSVKALASATRFPAILATAKNTEQDFKERQDLLRKMQTVEPEQLYESIHNLVGQPAPAHAVATAKVANTAVQYLVSKLPPPAQSPASALPFERRDPLPSKSEMQSFNATFEAVQNPKIVLEALGKGTLKPEHVDALKVVYPQIYQEVGTAITTYLSNNPTAIPYQSRLRLGTWFGQPTTKELSQSYLSTSQAAFQQDGNTGGAPNQPQTGSPRIGNITLGSRTSTPTQIAMAGKNS